jgi:hypothetical protein
MFGHGAEDMNGEAIGLGEVGGFELNSSFHKIGHESHISGEAV